MYKLLIGLVVLALIGEGYLFYNKPVQITKVVETSQSPVVTYGNAPIQNQYWVLSGTNLVPAVSTWGITFASLSPAGCVQVDSGGNFSSTGSGCSGGQDDWSVLNNNIYNANNGTVGLGTTSPLAFFTISNKVASAVSPFLVATSSSGVATTTVLQVDSNGNLLAGFNGSRIGLGTTTPFAYLSGVSSGILFALASSSTAGSALPVYEIDNKGHVITSGGSTSVSSCGTSAVSGNDKNGTVTLTGVALTACTINFAQTYAATPECIVTLNTLASVADVSAISTSAFTVGLSVGLNSGSIYYFCQQHQ